MVALSSVSSCLIVGKTLSDTTTARFRALPLAGMPEPIAVQVRSPHDHAGSSDDDCLITRIGGGDREALSELFRRFARPIRSVGRRILRNDAEADDLVQEVFLYIYRKSGVFDRSKSSARSWIFQIAYTQAFLRRRQLKSRGFYTSGITDNPHQIELPTSSAAHYDQTVEGLFGRNGWRTMLESLSEEQWETLRLHFFEGLTFGEIAERLGQSYANVRNYHYRGLEKLRKYLADNPLKQR